LQLRPFLLCNKYSEKEAIDLVEKDCFRQELIEWRVQKIGIAADNYYGPAIIMKGV
jgi:hypothetical protein